MCVVQCANQRSQARRCVPTYAMHLLCLTSQMVTSVSLAYRDAHWHLVFELHCDQGGSWGIFMDTPTGYTVEEVLELAHDRDGWRGMVEMLYKLKEPSRRRRQTAVRLQYEDKELDEEGAAAEGDEVLVAVKPDGIDQRWNTKLVSKLA